MALYTPDFEYIEAKKVIDNLGNSKKDKAIKYYIQIHQEHFNEQRKKLLEYAEWFNKLDRFLPNRNNTLI